MYIMLNNVPFFALLMFQIQQATVQPNKTATTVTWAITRKTFYYRYQINVDGKLIGRQEKEITMNINCTAINRLKLSIIICFFFLFCIFRIKWSEGQSLCVTKWIKLWLWWLVVVVVVIQIVIDLHYESETDFE